MHKRVRLTVETIQIEKRKVVQVEKGTACSPEDEERTPYGSCRSVVEERAADSRTGSAGRSVVFGVCKLRSDCLGRSVGCRGRGARRCFVSPAELKRVSANEGQARVPRRRVGRGAAIS